jgi:hypothetical protein
MASCAIGACIGLVIKDVHTAVPNLQEVDVAGDRPLGDAAARRKLDAGVVFERRDVALIEPDGNLDRDRHAVVGEHEVLQRLVTKFVVADGGNDEGCRVRGRVLFAVDDDAGRIRPRRRRLRSASLWIVVTGEEVVGAGCRNGL